MSTTPSVTATCECRQPGWCERHQCEKGAHWLRLCQSRPDYFQLWEEGRGPGQHSGEPARRNPVSEAPCRHQGPDLRTETCKTCQGNVRIKVFGCGIHGECTLLKRLSIDVVCCQTCADYLPTAATGHETSAT